MNEQELIELQTRLAFQDDAILELNATVARQQNQIDDLVRLVKHLQDQLKALTPSQVEGRGEEPPPPHY